MASARSARSGSRAPIGFPGRISRHLPRQSCREQRSSPSPTTCGGLRTRKLRRPVERPTPLCDRALRWNERPPRFAAALLRAPALSRRVARGNRHHEISCPGRAPRFAAPARRATRRHRAGRFRATLASARSFEHAGAVRSNGLEAGDDVVLATPDRRCGKTLVYNLPLHPRARRRQSPGRALLSLPAEGASERDQARSTRSRQCAGASGSSRKGVVENLRRRHAEPPARRRRDPRAPAARRRDDARHAARWATCRRTRAGKELFASGALERRRRAASGYRGVFGPRTSGRCSGCPCAARRRPSRRTATAGDRAFGD
jgi:hypothetical protein